MKYTPSKINRWMFLKLPAAWLTGVRLTSINDDICEVKVRHRWISQNPYRSMYWAVQGMAAELTTALMLTDKINKSGYDISMLLISSKSNYYKKATGTIVFNCSEGNNMDEMMNKLISSNTPQTITLSSRGINQNKVKVSEFIFEWSLKIREK